MQPPGQRVGGPGQGRQVVRLQQPQPVGGRQPPAAVRFIQQACDGGRQRRFLRAARSPGQPVPPGQIKEQFESLPLSRRQAKGEVIAEVGEAVGLGDADARGGLPGDLGQPREALVAGRPQRRARGVPCCARPGHPHGEDKGQPGPARPLLAQVPHRRELPLRRPHPPIADQQHRIGRTVGRGGADGQRLHGRRQAETLLQPDPHQGRAGARSFVQRQPADLRQRHAAIEPDAPHRALAGDAGVGDDRRAGIAEILDRGHQGHVQSPRRQGVGQPAGQIGDDAGGGVDQRRQAERQRPGVQVADRADAYPRRLPAAHFFRHDSIPWRNTLL